MTPECGGSAVSKLMKVNKVADHEHELDEATSFLVREWAGKLLNAKFTCLKDLTMYLIEKMFVDNRSSAAHTILTSMSKSGGNMIIIIDRLNTFKNPSCSSLVH